MQVSLFFIAKLIFFQGTFKHFNPNLIYLELNCPSLIQWVAALWLNLHTKARKKSVLHSVHWKRVASLIETAFCGKPNMSHENGKLKNQTMTMMTNFMIEQQAPKRSVNGRLEVTRASPYPMINWSVFVVF